MGDAVTAGICVTDLTNHRFLFLKATRALKSSILRGGELVHEDSNKCDCEQYKGLGDKKQVVEILINLMGAWSWGSSGSPSQQSQI